MDAGLRYPASATVMALVIQLPSACLEGPALGCKREEVLGRGRDSGGALRGPVVQLFRKLKSHGITVARGRAVPKPVQGLRPLGWGRVLEDGVSFEAGGFIGLPQKDTRASRPVLISMRDSPWL